MEMWWAPKVSDVSENSFCQIICLVGMNGSLIVGKGKRSNS